MIGSSLVNCSTKQAKYFSIKPDRVIKSVCIHHMAGTSTPAQCVDFWLSGNRETSSQYGVKDNQIGQFVGEENMAWCNGDSRAGNFAGNLYSVSIEVSNSGGAPNWPVSDATLATLIKLVADIFKRNNLGKAVLKDTLWCHQWVPYAAATACPGPYLLGKMQYIADEVNKINCGATPPKEDSTMKTIIIKDTGKNVEGFRTPDVNEVAVGHLEKTAAGTYPVRQVQTLAGSTLDGAQIYINGKILWVAVLTGATEIKLLSDADFFDKFLTAQPAGTGPDLAALNAEVNALTAKLNAANESVEVANKNTGMAMDQILKIVVAAQLAAKALEV